MQLLVPGHAGGAQDAFDCVLRDGRLHGTGCAEGFTRQINKLAHFLLCSLTYARRSVACSMKANSVPSN